jgi:putative inorganic carbon (hco3(-)) transporter
VSAILSTRTVSNLLYAMIAAVAGLALAFLPTQAAVLAIAVLALLILAAITPLAALIAMLILAPLRTLIATEAAFQLPLDIGQIALLGFLAAWVVYRITRQQPLLRLPLTPVYIPILLFMAAIAPGIFVAASASAWLSEWLKWMQILILIALCLTLRGAWEWMLFGLVIAGVANSLVGIYIFFGGSGALHLLILDRYFRAFGTFGQPNPFGGFMGLLIPLAGMAAFGYGLRLWGVWRAQRVIHTTDLAPLLFYTGALGLLLAGIYISWSRGAWLGLGVSLGVMLLALPRQTWRGVALFAAGAAVVGVLWLSGRLPASIVFYPQRRARRRHHLAKLCCRRTSRPLAGSAEHGDCQSCFWRGRGQLRDRLRSIPPAELEVCARSCPQLLLEYFC